MGTVKVTLKDGTVRKFSESRSGGSYSNSVRYEAAFAIVTDVWGNEYGFPAADVAEVNRTPERRGGW